MSIYTTAASLAFALTVFLPFSVSAQGEEQAQRSTGIEEVVVRAHPLSAEGLAQPVSMVSSEELQRIVGSSIGETLNHLSGVHSSSFGQAVGRPVIRGLGGPRVKTMEDRIDSLDVSVSSPDHLTPIEPFTADSIEVLKGPSTLLYGTGAIGGVVDVHTGRIPHQVPDGTSIMLDTRGADNGDRRSTSARFDAGGDGFAIHLDGFYRDADEDDIPGFAESRAQRRLEEVEHEEEGEEAEEMDMGYGEEADPFEEENQHTNDGAQPGVDPSDGGGKTSEPAGDSLGGKSSGTGDASATDEVGSKETGDGKAPGHDPSGLTNPSKKVVKK